MFGLVSAVVLVAVGARTAWSGLRARLGLELAGDVVAPGPAFVTAVAATALNPLTIALWTISFPAAGPGSAVHSGVGSAALIAGLGLVGFGALLGYRAVEQR